MKVIVESMNWQSFDGEQTVFISGASEKQPQQKPQEQQSLAERSENIR